MLNLHEPVVISIALEPRHTISRDFVLKVDIGDWRTVVMRVEMFSVAMWWSLMRILGGVLQWRILPIKMGIPIRSGVEASKVVVRVLVLT